MRKSFPKMVEVIPEGSLGEASVTHFEVTPEDAQFTLLRAVAKGRPQEFVYPGHYARLQVRHCLMMTDTQMERKTNAEFLRRARGKVLVAGLGLGMILHPILQADDVTSVLVVEKYKDVIDLVGPHVRQFPGADTKLKIVQGDIFEWKPDLSDLPFNSIYFDIWACQSPDTLVEMKKLHRRAAKWKAPGCWVASWKVAGFKCR